MTYDEKNRVLHTGVHTKVETITPLEHKFLLALKGENFVSYEELCQKLYGIDDYTIFDKDCLECIRIIKSRLMKKTNNQLRIVTKRGLGYKIENLYYER